MKFLKLVFICMMPSICGDFWNYHSRRDFDEKDYHEINFLLGIQGLFKVHGGTLEFRTAEDVLFECSRMAPQVMKQLLGFVGKDRYGAAWGLSLWEIDEVLKTFETAEKDGTVTGKSLNCESCQEFKRYMQDQLAACAAREDAEQRSLEMMRAVERTQAEEKAKREAKNAAVLNEWKKKISAKNS